MVLECKDVAQLNNAIHIDMCCSLRHGYELMVLLIVTGAHGKGPGVHLC